MKDTFNLSKKVFQDFKGKDNIYFEKDVKEFIRRLKKNYDKNCKGIPPVMTYGELIIELNKLCGEELK